MTTAPTFSETHSQAGGRSLAPVFVLGCGRSGTTLLYHMLLSAGNFAVYRVESNIINLLEPRFGDLSVRRATSAGCWRPGITAAFIRCQDWTKKK